ncbi:unnamed protein product [Absidia cylindrospora]
MAIDEQVEQLDKDTPQQQQTPFQVVLIDIAKTLEKRAIHCVQRALDEPELKFVALSYRWGELHETVIDTGVGYTASITSFDLKDFYGLCHMMTFESDLKHIPYVWVDTICVDQRPEKRKAVIYQMSNIYDKATYILAVPDLHLTHLKGVSIKNDETIEGSHEYRKDMYHLIHGNTAQLAALEHEFLDDIQVPTEPPALRQLLLDYTDHFSPSFMTYQTHHQSYCAVRALEHICDTTRPRRPWRAWIKDKFSSTSKHSIGDVHQCQGTICPLELFDKPLISTKAKGDIFDFTRSNWKSKVIQRSTKIRQSMEFLTSLVVDWSSRVWVISEFNIAKKKNNLKFWFTQFGYFRHGIDYTGAFCFFTFDFDDTSSFVKDMLKRPYYENQHEAMMTRLETTNPIYIRFHYTMIQQLGQQTFLEMILCSKASRHVDRFHSTLPISEYHARKSDIDQWHIRSMVSVKLKLYEIMHMQDRMTLLFWSSDKSAANHGVLPTFATPMLSSQFPVRDVVNEMYIDLCNFDLNDPSSIMLHQDDGGTRSYLRLKPKEYKITKHDPLNHDRIDFLARSIPVLKQLQVDAQTLDIVSIPALQKRPASFGPEKYCQSRFVTLVGCFATNTWIMAIESSPDYYPQYVDGQRVVVDQDDHPSTFFDVY